LSDGSATTSPTTTAQRAPHPFVWTILYLPFGALSGFVTVALTFLATEHGLSISEGALLNGAQMLTQWLKWIWAPIVDVTLTPRRWYVISTVASGLGIFAMSAIPLGPSTLGPLLAVIAAASLINSVVGMAVEAIIASSTPADQVGRVSAWFQVGNLGGAGLGGALGLFLITTLPAPWMAGAIMAVLFVACCFALRFTPVVAPRHTTSALEGVRDVVRSLRTMLKTKGGLLSAILCVLPIGTGTAQVVLTQSNVAAYWHAGKHEVELLQGLVAGFVTSIGCFVGGWLCHRFHPRTAYAGIGVVMAITACLIGIAPATVNVYIFGNLFYAFVVGLAYAAFSAVVLESMGHGAGATKYNVFASLSNFPIWWLGLVLGFAAEKWGARDMLFTEAAFGLLGVTIFGVSVMRVRRSALAEA
jgi:MFS family permease